MKNLSLSLLCLLCTQAYSQTPDYFANEPVWREDLTQAYSSQCFDISERQIYVNGDTLMSNGMSYKNLYTVTYHWTWDLGNPTDCYEPPYYSHEFFAAVRQSNDSIFQYDTYEQSEILALHYSLSIGDTLQGAYYYDNGSPESIVVIGIDSIETANGLYRRFSLSPEFNFSPEYLIEGVGSAFGFLSSIGYSLNGTNELVCFRQNGEYVYGFVGECTVISSNPEWEQLKLSVHPNPSTDGRFILRAEGLKELQHMRIRLIPLDGRSTQEITAIPSGADRWILNVQEYGPGIYLLQIDDEKGVGMVKVIVE